MSSSQHILILTPQLPYPPHQGASLRNFYIIKGLAQRHAITLLSFVDPDQHLDSDPSGPLTQLCTHVYTIPAPPRTRAQRLRQLLFTDQPDMAFRLSSSAFTTRLREVLHQQVFDIVQVEGLELARYIPIVRQASPRSHIVFDDHNAEAALQQRAFLTDLRQPRRWGAALYSSIQVRRLRRFETWACQQADQVTAVSEADQETLQGLVPEKRVTPIPNCIDVATYDLPPDGLYPTFDLVFSGKMDYRPNVDAMLWFVAEIWPRIREARPQATLAVVGQKPHPRLEPLYHLPGVTMTGWVESVQPYLAGATVYVMPFRMGSGTRLKLIEAMAAGKAIVSTPIGAEGFPVVHNEHLMLASTPNEFATAVLTLLTQPPRRQKLGNAARQFAQQYDWRQVVQRFEAVYASVIS
ncbi:MAG: glycosyltransferase [Anaerolineales bacterium]|nr:glycosyltransferase [Anaerolineales bacterium]MCB8952119.1 glycosyltransferase [Ardenticatenales bacterium]